jgi:hypothetical protein
VVGLFNQMNRLADAYQVEPDIRPVIEPADSKATKRRRPSAKRQGNGRARRG